MTRFNRNENNSNNGIPDDYVYGLNDSIHFVQQRK